MSQNRLQLYKNHHRLKDKLKPEAVNFTIRSKTLLKIRVYPYSISGIFIVVIQSSLIIFVFKKSVI